MNFEKKANNYLNPKQKSKFKAIFKHFKLKTTTREGLAYHLYIKPKIMHFLRLFTVLDRLPKSALFVLLVIFMFSILMVNQYVIKEFWMNTVIEAFPDLTTGSVDAEGKLQLSPIDKIFVESTARTQGYLWILFWGMSAVIYGEIARGYVPRKPQTIPNLRRFK